MKSSATLSESACWGYLVNHRSDAICRFENSRWASNDPRGPSAIVTSTKCGTHLLGNAFPATGFAYERPRTRYFR